MPQVQIIDEIIQVPVKNEVRPQEEFGDCPVEVPQLQIIDKIGQVPIKKEAHPQEEFSDCPVELSNVQLSCHVTGMGCQIIVLRFQ